MSPFPQIMIPCFTSVGKGPELEIRWAVVMRPQGQRATCVCTAFTKLVWKEYMLALQKSLLKFITVHLDTFTLQCARSLLLMTWGPHDSQWHIRKPQKADKTGFPKASVAGAQTLPATPKLWQGGRYQPMRRSQRRPPTPREGSVAGFWPQKPTPHHCAVLTVVREGKKHPS